MAKVVGIRFKQVGKIYYFDPDGKEYNEGDFAIQRLANIISSCCGVRSIGARFGGDEFVIFSVDPSEGAIEALEHKFNTELDNINSLVKKPYVISASIGSIITPAKEGDTLYSVIKMADEKMYDVKKQKKRARKSEKV